MKTEENHITEKKQTKSSFTLVKYLLFYFVQETDFRITCHTVYSFTCYRKVVKRLLNTRVYMKMTILKNTWVVFLNDAVIEHRI